MADDPDIYSSCRATAGGPRPADLLSTARLYGAGEGPSLQRDFQPDMAPHHGRHMYPSPGDRAAKQTPFVKQSSDPVASHQHGGGGGGGGGRPRDSTESLPLYMDEDMYGTSAPHEPYVRSYVDSRGHAGAPNLGAGAGHGGHHHLPGPFSPSAQTPQHSARSRAWADSRQPPHAHAHDIMDSPQQRGHGRAAYPSVAGDRPLGHEQDYLRAGARVPDGRSHLGPPPANWQFTDVSLPRFRAPDDHQQGPTQDTSPGGHSSDHNMSWSSPRDAEAKRIELEAQELEIEQANKMLEREKKKISEAHRELDLRTERVVAQEKAASEKEAALIQCERTRKEVMANTDQLKKENLRSEEERKSLEGSIRTLNQKKARLLEDIDELSKQKQQLQDSLRDDVRGGAAADHSSQAARPRVLRPSDPQPAPRGNVPSQSSAQVGSSPSRGTQVSSSPARSSPPLRRTSGSTSTSTRTPVAQPSSHAEEPEFIRQLYAHGALDGVSPHERDRIIAMAYQNHERKQLEEESMALARQLDTQQHHEAQRTSESTATQLQAEERRRLQERKELEQADMRLAQQIARQEEEERERERNRVEQLAQQTASELEARADAQEARGGGGLPTPAQPQGIDQIHSQLRNANGGM